MNLRSRYGDIWELEEIEGGYLWSLPDYTRYGYFSDSPTEICFIDPPGGPFIEVGGEIKEGEIVISLDINQDGKLLICTRQKNLQKQGKN